MRSWKSTSSLGSKTSIPRTEASESDLENEKCVEISDLKSPRILPPINWKPQDETFTLSTWLYVAILVYSTAILSTALAVYKLRTDTHENNMFDKCDMNRTDSMSTSERRFQVDGRLRSDLTFAQAKLLDLGWNMVIGHGGRIIHGLVFYHIACRTVTWILETSALSHSTTIDLLLWPDSWASLSTIVSSAIFSKQRIRVVFALVLMAYGVAHALCFSIIWGAAAGYQSITLVAYPMPDQTWVTKETEELSICWSLDPLRLRGTPIAAADPVVLGPKFSSFQIPFARLGEVDMWNYYDASSAPTIFQEVYAYSRLRSAMQSSLRGLNASSLKTPDLTTRYWDAPLELSSWYHGPWTVAFHDRDPDKRLPKTIVGWYPSEEYFYYDMAIVIPEYNKNERDAAMKLQQKDSGRTTWEASPSAIFRLDSSISLTNTSSNLSSMTYNSTIPYNSTIWFNETKIPLQAPFLEFGKDCRWSSSLLGECVCYKGKPVTEDFRVESRLLCTSGERYYWGISCFFTLVGLVLELVWCIIVVYLLSSSTRNSALLRMGRPTVGSVRNILDIAQVINAELGDNTCLYRDHELKRQLSQCPPVGYTITERKDGVKHLGLVPVSNRYRRKRSMWINGEDKALYG